MNVIELEEDRDIVKLLHDGMIRGIAYRPLGGRWWTIRNRWVVLAWPFTDPAEKHGYLRRSRAVAYMSDLLAAHIAAEDEWIKAGFEGTDEETY